MTRIVRFLFIVGMLPGFAQAGMVVSDPTSYTYYVDQLKKMQEQQKELSDQTLSLADIKKMAVESKKWFTGTYNHGMKLLAYIQAVESGDWGAVPDTFKGIQDYLGFMCDTETERLGKVPDDPICNPTSQGEGKGKDGKEYGAVEATEDILSAAFGDPTSPHYNPWIVKNYKFAVEQMSRENTIKESQRILNKQPARMARIEAMAAQIDTTENVKSSADLTNRMLAEILLAQTEIIAVLTKMAETQALDGYVGTAKKKEPEPSSKKKDALLDYMREGSAKGRAMFDM